MRCFDFRCDDCGRVFEELVESHDERPACTGCGSSHTTRQLSGFAIGRSSGGASNDFDAGSFTGGGCANGMCGI